MKKKYYFNYDLPKSFFASVGIPLPVLQSAIQLYCKTVVGASLKAMGNVKGVSRPMMYVNETDELYVFMVECRSERPRIILNKVFETVTRQEIVKAVESVFGSYIDRKE